MAEKDAIVAVILSGGLARRFGGKEKGLERLKGKPMISHIIERLSPQVGEIYLNINRLHQLYQQHYPDIPTYSDKLSGFQGALSGMLSGIEQIVRDYFLFVPCDSPFLPQNLVEKLATALRINQAKIAYAHDGQQAQPTFVLLHRSIATDLATYLRGGERRLLQFFQRQHAIAVDFSEQPLAFQNFNSATELASGQIPLTQSNIPLLAITAYSGTGKTTLLEKLLPELRTRGVRAGLIKHSHHNVDVDKAGKDSYRLRLAGANPTMVVCDQRWALMAETAEPAEFASLVAQFDPQTVDLILVEGFKHEALPKIQLHRQGIEKPLPDLDDFTVATATDYPVERENHLDINDISQIADFICDFLAKTTACK